MKLLQLARAKMMLNHAFFASLLMSLDMIETDAVPTMGTDMKRIYVNPDFVEKELATVPRVLFVLAHEVMHVALEHGLRVGQRNPMLWNIACDFAINLILEEAGFEYPGNGCLDHKYKGMSADQIYDLLQKQADKERAKGNSGKPGEGGMPGLDKLHGPDGDLMSPEGGNNPAEEAKTRRQIQQKVAQAAQMARMAGQLSGELERLVGEILDPKVPWQDLLRDYVTRVTKDDESWGRRNRRFQNVYLPTRHSERMGEIVLIGDTSGSIGGSELQQYASEANAIIEQVKPERVRILWADTQVAGEQVFEEGDKFDPRPQGGGGTDMRVPLKHAEQFEPEVVILFTDGYTPWPEVEPSYRLIVCCTTDAACPVGLVVRI